MGKNTVVVEQGYLERDPETGEEEEWRGCDWCGMLEGMDHEEYCPLHSNNGDREWLLDNVIWDDASPRYRHSFFHGCGSWQYKDKNDPRNEM